MTLKQVLCGIWGHERVFRFENRGEGLPCRVLLHCPNCQHDTPGLVPEKRTPVQTFPGDPRRYRPLLRNVLRKSA